METGGVRGRKENLANARMAGEELIATVRILSLASHLITDSRPSMPERQRLRRLPSSWRDTITTERR